MSTDGTVARDSGVVENAENDDQEVVAIKGVVTPEEILNECLGGISGGTKNRGVTTVYEKNGGYTATVSDFWRTEPCNVTPFATPKCSGLTGILPDGRTITARTYSSDGRPTLEIINSQYDYISMKMSFRVKKALFK